jgi:hypothetical protein
MNELKRLSILIFVTAACLSAAPLCTNASLESYLTNNNGLANACEINGVLFFNFTYTGSLATTDYVPASDVNVVVSPSGFPGGLEFDGQWSISSSDTDPTGVNGPVYEDLHVTFEVMAAGALPIVTVHNDTKYSTIAGGTVSRSATCDSPCAVPVSNFAGNTESLISSTFGPFTIRNDFQLTANGENDQAHFSVILDEVTLTDSLVSLGVPEPVTTSLTGGALLFLGLLKRRSRYSGTR